MNAPARFSPIVARPEAFLDANTGLMVAAMDVSAKSMTHAEAEKAVKEFRCAGFSDWRLPTIDELESLRDRTRYNPAADPLLNLKPDWYWSASPSAVGSGCSWVVGFGYGSSGTIYRGYHAFVRAVRSARQ